MTICDASYLRSPRTATCLCLCVVWACLFSLKWAVAADRVAFVLGVDRYVHLSPEAQLQVAVRDATRMSDTLKALDPPFQVTLVTEADWKTAQEQFDAFLDRARGAECALVYFAGHGIEYHGENFLLVRDSDLADVSPDVERMKRRLATAAVSLQGWVDSLDATRAQVKLVVLDCCRDNPLQATDSTGRRAVVGARRGLAQITPPSGSLISYSADAGQQANDGLFTEVLTKHLKDPRLSILKVFAATREEVLETSEKWAAEDAALPVERRRVRHEPAEYNKLNLAGTDFVFHGRGWTPPPPLSTSDRLRAATKDAPFVNSLGLEFVPVPGKDGVFLCRTETRVRDFRAYAEAEDYTQTGGAYVMKATEKGTSWELDTTASWEKPGFSQSEDHPVTCVSWLEARAFCAWLSKQEKGLTYRLPWDAEWSAAVGSIGKYPWGNAWPPPVGAGNYAGSEWAKNLPGKGWPTAYDHDDGAERTARVGLFTENRFGFFDLGGNVWEWCEDEYRASMNDADALEQVPALKTEKYTDGTPYRVVRGASWVSVSEVSLRSSSRIRDLPTGRSGTYGFRLVVVVGGVGG